MEPKYLSISEEEFEKKARIVPIWTAIVDGTSPSITAVLAISPFLISILTPIPNLTAAYISVGLTLTVLFLLGAYLGKISNRNTILHGFKMLVAGLVMTIILFLLRQNPG